MAQSIFKKDVAPRCGICEFGSPAGGAVVCKKRGGVVQPDSQCPRFRYDPFKREPKIARAPETFDKEDFSL